MQVEAEQRAQDMFRKFMLSYSGTRLRMMQGNPPQPAEPPEESPMDELEDMIEGED